jgi:hypothetical protein
MKRHVQYWWPAYGLVFLGLFASVVIGIMAHPQFNKCVTSCIIETGRTMTRCQAACVWPR